MDASFLDISLWASTKSNKDTIKIIQFSLNKYRHGYYANSNCLLYNSWTPCSFWAAGLNEAYVSVEISKTLICGRRKACGPDVDERPCGKLRSNTTMKDSNCASFSGRQNMTGDGAPAHRIDIAIGPDHSNWMFVSPLAISTRSVCANSYGSRFWNWWWHRNSWEKR